MLVAATAGIATNRQPHRLDDAMLHDDTGPIGTASFIDNDGQPIFLAAGEPRPWWVRRGASGVSTRYRLRARARIDWPQLCSLLGIRIYRRGATRSQFYALCVFHDEKTPSMSFTVDGKYHCFGCGESGDIADFVSMYRGFSRSIDVRGYFHSSRFPLMQQPASDAAHERDQALARYLDDMRLGDREAMARYCMWRYPDHKSVPPLRYVRGR